MIDRGKLASRTAGLGVVLVWSTCFVAIKGTEEAAPPLLYAALRSLVAAAALLPLALLRRRLSPPAREWPWLIALGFSSTTLGLAGMFLGVGLAGATLPAVLTNSQALLAAPFAVLFFGERLSARRLAGLVVGISGVATTLAAGADGDASRAMGLWLGILSAVGLAAGNLLMKYLASRVDAVVAVTWQYTTGGLLLFLWSRLAEGPVPVSWASPRFVAGLLYLGVVGSAGASAAWYVLLRRSALNPLNALTLLTPALSVLLAWSLFREPVSLRTGIGIAATLIGVALSSLPSSGRPWRSARGPIGDVSTGMAKEET